MKAYKVMIVLVFVVAACALWFGLESWHDLTRITSHIERDPATNEIIDGRRFIGTMTAVVMGFVLIGLGPLVSALLTSKHVSRLRIAAIALLIGMIGALVFGIAAQLTFAQGMLVTVLALLPGALIGAVSASSPKSSSKNGTKDQGTAANPSAKMVSVGTALVGLVLAGVMIWPGLLLGLESFSVVWALGWLVCGGAGFVAGCMAGRESVVQGVVAEKKPSRSYGSGVVIGLLVLIVFVMSFVMRSRLGV